MSVGDGTPRIDSRARNEVISKPALALAPRFALRLASPAAAAHRGLSTGINLAGEVSSGRTVRPWVVVVSLGERHSALTTI